MNASTSEDLKSPRTPLGQRPVARYVFAAVAIALALIPQWLLTSVLPSNFFLIVWPALFLISWICGFGPSLLALAIATPAVAFLIMAPHFHITQMGGQETARLAIFVIMTILVTWIVDRGSRAEKTALDRLEREEIAERKFLRSEALLQTITESIPDPVYLKDRDSRLLLANAATLKVVGKTAEQILGRTDREIYEDREVGERLLSTDLRIMNSGVGETLEERVQTLEGYRFFLSTKSPYRNPNGEIIGLVGISRDITERKLAEDAVKRSREDWAFLANASNLLAHSLDFDQTLKTLARLVLPRLADLAIIDLFEGGEKIRRVAVESADPTQQPIIDEFKLHPPTLDSASASAEAIRTGKPVMLLGTAREHALKNSPGSTYFKLAESLGATSLLSFPLLARGKTLGAMMFILTKKGRTYSEVDTLLAQKLVDRAAIAVDNARLYAELQRALSLRDEFLSIASHELKTPVTALQLQLEMIHRMNKQPDAQAPLIESAKNQIKKLIVLLNDLLDVTRARSGTLTYTLETVDLSALARDVADKMSPALSKARCSLSIDLAPGILGRWDRTRIEQVIVNLLSNAAKYAPGESVRLSTGIRDGRATLTVADTGPGIPKESHNRIFERFERGTPEKGVGGMGLGLYIVRTIVEAHGGTVSVESDKGKGASFSVSLPLNISG